LKRLSGLFGDAAASAMTLSMIRANIDVVRRDPFLQMLYRFCLLFDELCVCARYRTKPAAIILAPKD
jgi:hypothetical protein